MKILKIILMLTACVLSVSGLAQSTTTRRELSGIRTGANNSTTATFSVGLSRNSGASYVTSAAKTETILIDGLIRPEAAHVGQRGDLFLVAQLGTVFYMRNVRGQYVVWNQKVPDLQPWREDVTLTEAISVEFLRGKLPLTGDIRLFLGYLPEDGRLYYTPAPHKITITEQTAREQARSLFDSSISPNIIHTRCINCHVSGGQAQGLAQHIFVRSSATNHLDTNFAIFETLLNSRGKAFILSKASGGQGHIGGVQLTTNSQDYQNLDTFLTLLGE